MNLHLRYGILAFTLVTAIAAVMSLPPIPQDLHYHAFADMRAFFGVPNFMDVASNAGFIVTGIFGFIVLAKNKSADNRLNIMWGVFFAGVILTCFGSSFYHLAPDNNTLVWDRLPMTIAFMSLSALLVSHHINGTLGWRLFPLLLTAGIGSVFYWEFSGDLRAYALVQFASMALAILIFTLFPSPKLRRGYLMLTLAFYILAKLLEHFDAAVFSATTGIIGGHALKHLSAAIAIIPAAYYMKYALKNNAAA